jgi:uncharacterized protein YdeI (YjbR/CyaY-like superfamily)
MPTHDNRIDAYIGKAQPFAQPILEYLREVVHAGCPEVEETIKWSMPHFVYKGLFCAMAGFKQHCALHIFNDKLVMKEAKSAEKDGMGSLGKITSLKDLPPRSVLVGYIKKAKALKDSGVVSVMGRKNKTPKPPAKAPAYLTAALKKNKKAQTTFAAFSPSAQREYIEWLTEAKTEETRDRRLEQAVGWIREGKKRNWKYENC